MSGQKTSLTSLKTLLGSILAIGLIPSSLFSIFMRPDLDRTPVPRLIENIEKLVAAEPKNATLLINLARVHGMAYAKKTDELEIEKRKPNEAWFGYLPPRIPFGEIVPLDEQFQRNNQLDGEAMQKLKATAAEHLEKSIAAYRQALEVEKDNATAELGLAWALDQKGNEEEAVDLYRKLVATGWEKEKDMTHGGLAFKSIVAESAGYLLQKLDPKKDKAEIADLQAKIDKVSQILRPVTPIAIPLGNPGWSSVYDPIAKVAFDADGTGHRRSWTWIHPTAGWLVYDHQQNGQINSALQLFGSVTFWCFWVDGYGALRTLDDNGDGWLRGNELHGLAIWQDVNQNGQSELGEVRPLTAHDITAVSCNGFVSSFDGQIICFNPRGVQNRDGSFRPSYDVILHRTPSSPDNLPESRPITSDKSIGFDSN